MKYKAVFGAFSMRFLGNGPRILIAALISLPHVVHSAGEITSILTSKSAAVQLQYSVDGNSYFWGAGDNQQIEGFIYNGNTYRYISDTAEVSIKRVDRPGVSTGNPCGVFAERAGGGYESIAPSYPSDGSNTGNCDMEAMLEGRIVNRGTLDTFSNTGPHPKNIERIDFVFSGGLSTPVEPGNLAASGHIVAEKRGNNPVQIAAILSIDGNGTPSAYGPLVRVEGAGCTSPAICYGITELQHNYSFFESPANDPQGYATHTGDSTEYVGMAFVNALDLGLTPAQTYYGFSYFPRDVSAVEHNLLDPASFPENTADDYIAPSDGADIYGGVAAYFLLDTSGLTTADVYFDQNGNAIHDADEAGIAGISTSLYLDVNANGMLDPLDTMVGEILVSGPDGMINIPSLPEGNYLLLLDEGDADIPAGLEVPAGSNPVVFSVTGASQNQLQFAFIDSSGGGSTNAGIADAGTTGNISADDTPGATESGNGSGNTAGSGTGSDTSGSDSAGTSGNSTSGSTAGSSTAGSTTGSSTAGTTGANTGGETGGTGTGGVLTANPDRVFGNQNNPIRIDVTANDVDPIGDGLTVLSVESVENGTAQLDGNIVVFTPDYQFLGEESFVYTIEDSSGAMASGTVTVSVQIFNDFNNNNINDYDECDCTDLRLITGVDGTGIGVISKLILTIMPLMLILRRWKLHLGGPLGRRIKLFELRPLADFWQGCRLRFWLETWLRFWGTQR